MNPDNPANRKLLNLTLLVLLAPLYATVLFAPYTGILRTLAQHWAQGTPMAAPLLYVFLLSCVASIAWLLWRGALVGPITVLLVTLVVSGVTSNYSSNITKTYELAIGAGAPLLGIDVYCNDVHLGKTPLTISLVDFDNKVAPWDTPPDQPIMTLGDSDEDDRYSWAKLLYVPHDIFEEYKNWPPKRDRRRYRRDTDAETLEDIKHSLYWWRFEKDGCVGLTSLSGFSNGANGSSNGRTTIRSHPNTTFVSADKHLDIVLVQLQADNLHPTDTWLSHFLAYKDLLFLEFHRRAMRDRNLQPALDAIVRAEFHLPPTPSESDCRRLVNEITNRAARSGCFTIPSLESLGILTVAKVHPQPIIDGFLAPLEVAHSALNSSGTMGSGDLITHRKSGPRAKRLPLEYAIKQTMPPKLFDRLVYMSRRGGYMDLLGNYPRKELIWLFSHYLRKVDRQGGQIRDMRIKEAIKLCAQVVNPLIEETVRQFVHDKAGQSIGSRSYVRQFIDSRIDNPLIDQGQLARWIFNEAPSQDRDKFNFLLKIQDANACQYLSMIISRDKSRRDDVIYKLGNDPNPAFDTFIIDTYNWYESPQGRGNRSQSLTYAVVKTDTPAMREFIKAEWNESDETRTRLIKHVNSGDWRQPHMKWLVPLIADLTSKSDRASAVKLLSRIDTPEAYKLAEQWATDTDADIATAATAQLAIRDERATRRQKKLALAAGLLSGKMKPDDLLSSTVAYTWNGNEYTPDKATP
ncbi:MAG: hypothetical protein GY809_28260 [Planctomycetes bacterium]|nr:hypothetical protein [Planctomycetota bacterium]